MQKLKETYTVSGGFPQRGPVTFAHLDYLQLLKDGYVAPSFDDRSFKFTIARNPFDRAISLFYYLRLRGRVNDDFTAFLDRVEQGVEPIGLYNAKGWSQANPQVSWLRNRNGAIEPDLVCKVENLAEDTHRLARELGIKPFNVHVNKSKKTASDRDLYRNDENVRRVLRVYREDFAYFGYPEQLPY